MAVSSAAAACAMPGSAGPATAASPSRSSREAARRSLSSRMSSAWPLRRPSSPQRSPPSYIFFVQVRSTFA